MNVSILLPVKNAESTLNEAIDSCLAQTYTAFELLIVDDQCSDGSIQLIETINDPRIKLVKNQGEGLVDALNTGLNAVQSPFIARMDADDVMHSERLMQQLAAFQNNPELAVVASQVDLFPADVVQGGFQNFIDWQNRQIYQQQIYQQRFVETPITHPSVMFRREVVVKAGGYRKGDFPEDYELWLRLLAKDHQFAKVPMSLLAWRESTQRLSRTARNCRRQAFDQLRASYLAIELGAIGDRPIVIWGAGRRTRQRAQHLIALGIQPTAWIDIDPNKIGQQSLASPVHAPNWLTGRSPKPFVLNYVSNRGARELIEKDLLKIGYLPQQDFYSVG